MAIEEEIWRSGDGLPGVVVIGAGFAGLNLVKILGARNCRILLIDRHNYHQFQPLLYQVAISGLEPDSIVSPVRKLFIQRPELRFMHAEVLGVDVDAKYVQLDAGRVFYDVLVFAHGSRTNFFGNANIEAFSFGLKSINDALNLRSWIIQNLEQASIRPNKTELMQFVIAGAGPAGVEMAGALAEFKTRLLKKDYPRIKPDNVKIFLIEGGPDPLPSMSVKARKRARQVIEEMGIVFVPNALVKDFDKTRVLYSQNGELHSIVSNTLIWTAGVMAERIEGLPSSVFGPGNRLKVNDFLEVEGLKQVYAVGDVAYLCSAEFERGLPMVAQTAIQQGKYLAEALFKKSVKPFEYKNRGSMAIIGMNKAVADIKNVFLSGNLGWLIWSYIHIISISSFKNRLSVAFNWWLKYWKYEHTNQLIIRKVEK